MNFDITFCRGVSEDSGKICPIRDKCERYWTKDHSKKCIETGHIYNSFCLVSADEMAEKGCKLFWRKK